MENDDYQELVVVGTKATDHTCEVESMSIKKELLSQMSLQQLKKLAEKKGISFSLSDRQKEYYSEWTEKDRMVDMMTDKRDLSIKEIEDHIRETPK